MLQYDRVRAALRARPAPAARRRRRATSRTAGARPRCDAVTVPWKLAAIGADRVALRRSDGAVRAPRRTIAIGGGRLDPTLSVEVEVTNASRRPRRRAARHRVRDRCCSAAATIRPRSTPSTGGGSPTTSGSRSRDVDRLRAGNEQLGVAIETVADAAGRAPGSPRSRACRTRSPASSSSTRAARSCSHRQIALAPGERAVAPRRAAGDRATADRSAPEAAARP